MELTELEPRLNLNVTLALSQGILYERVGSNWVYEVKVFDDPTIGGTIAVSENEIFVGAAAPGGPHLKTFNRSYQEINSEFVGDPASRMGVQVAVGTRTSINIKTDDPIINSYLSRIPDLPQYDFSKLQIHVINQEDWPPNKLVPGAAVGYFEVLKTGPQIMIKKGAEWAVIHEVGHSIGYQQKPFDLSEEFAWNFVQWVRDYK